MKKALYLLLIGMTSLPLLAADELLSIEDLMTRDELRATGIDDLSPNQIEALNEWLLRFRDGEVSQAITEAPASTDLNRINTAAAPQVPDVYPPPRESVTINSRIDGEFNGWTGRTRFTLQNGQVWEQRRGRRWKITLDNPEVRLSQNFMGAWEMEVISEDRSIGVRRIR